MKLTNLLFASLPLALLSACAAEAPHSQGPATSEPALPNILIAIADDAGHMGEAVSWVDTPAFDRVAAAGLRFANAYTPNAKCAPSRAALLTARNSWQLKEAANHFVDFPAEFKTYPEALRDAGYAIGYTGKGWGPGNPGEIDGKPRELIGPAWLDAELERPRAAIANIDYAANFADFLDSRPKGRPFHFWYGSYEPHRRFEYGSSMEAGKKLSDIDRVPSYFPDNEVVRTDLLDYALEIEHFDHHLGRILDNLEEQGELANTLVIVTSDHGMPFPRAKSDEYEASNHVPLAIMWGDRIQDPGRVIEEYVSFIDFAPTLFELADISWADTGMQPTPGLSLAPFFESPADDAVAFRDHVLIGKERHDVGRPDDYGYPIRGMVHDGWLYLRNYRPELWPAGNPETGYSTVDASPTKTEVLKARRSPETRYLWELSFGKRPTEELYRLDNDPDCVDNLAAAPEHLELKERLASKMERELEAQADPRMAGEGDLFHTYHFTWDRVRNYYQRRIVEGEDLVAPWIHESDIETDVVGD